MLFLNFLPPVDRNCFFFNQARGIRSVVTLRLVGSHFEKTKKALVAVNTFDQIRGKEYHFRSIDRTLSLKVTTVSRRQLEQLGVAHNRGKEGFLASTSRNVLDWTINDHTAAKKQGNDARVIDSILQSSVSCAANADIYQMKEMNGKWMSISYIIILSMINILPEMTLTRNII